MHIFFLQAGNINLFPCNFQITSYFYEVQTVDEIHRWQWTPAWSLKTSYIEFQLSPKNISSWRDHQHTASLTLVDAWCSLTQILHSVFTAILFLNFQQVQHATHCTNTERLDLNHKSHVFTLPLPHQFPPNVVRLHLHHSSYRDFQRTPSLYSPSEKAQTRKSVFCSQLGDLSLERQTSLAVMWNHRLFTQAKSFASTASCTLSDGNKYTTAHDVQFASKTFSFIQASLFPCSCYHTACPGT